MECGYYDDKITEDEMGGECRIHGRKVDAYCGVQTRC
jgi:hypothetical protein